jgi:hypothetical protein
VLLATTGTATPTSSSGTEPSKALPAAGALQDAVPGPDSHPHDAVKKSAAEAVPACEVPSGVSPAGQQHAQRSSRSGRQGALLLSSLTLTEVLTNHTTAHIIASDVRVVLDIMESSAEDFDAWAAAKQQEQHARMPSQPQPLAKHSMAYQPAVAGAVWRARAAQHSHGGSKPAADSNCSAVCSTGQVSTTGTHQQLEKPGCSEGSCRAALAQATAQTPEHAETEQPAAGDTAPAVSCQRTDHSDSRCLQAASMPASLDAATHQLRSAQGLPDAAERSHSKQPASSAHAPAAAHVEACNDPGHSASSANSRRTTAEPASQGQSFKKAPAGGLMGLSSRSLLAALPAALGHAGSSGHDGGAHARRRRLGAIQVTRGAASLRHDAGKHMELQLVVTKGILQACVCMVPSMHACMHAASTCGRGSTLPWVCLCKHACMLAAGNSCCQLLPHPMLAPSCPV